MADEKKEPKDPKKAEKKVFDEEDEAFIGYCSFQTLDEDGIAGRTVGCSVQAPVHIISVAGADDVVFEAQFLTSNPLFFLEMRNEERFYLFGQWWMDGPKYSEAKEFSYMVPIRMQDCHKMAETTANEFKAQAICDAIGSSSTRQMQVTCCTEEKKFKSKLAKVHLTIPRAAWLEYKAYRVRMWKASKLGVGGGGGGGDDDEEKKEEKKDE
eukprot:CAMPEP_0203963612 /NCGR_PEP_ID=MMETSP0359-20131031/93523_1 /ASSEMBLY_ACC=CAM_ASM_000338 /TAXON_ID=268821 /ORGANISM="Scrippsiella Hangoei, Strain SHTV-5" /LENGTH=210 /DNA_ID=CAMNT_0050899543 /DNA_START=62 /DNA_END=694 /DNA_ORIENTATION=+